MGRGKREGEKKGEEEKRAGGRRDERAEKEERGGKWKAKGDKGELPQASANTRVQISCKVLPRASALRANCFRMGPYRCPLINVLEGGIFRCSSKNN